ncbi:coiled-coil and C2 domain-containing protein 1-like [Bolinopsis microptera]|uniref:coiled-coil and C2 domain-containing protein 1-like n=1 Tax=Bolinopsis microptera TaxID=2820187 RepID=UPI00307AFF78
MLGDNVDLSLIPPDPTEYMASKQGNSGPVAPPPAANPTPAPVRAPAPSSPARPAGVLVSDEQATIVALNFRLDAYKKQQEKAQAEGNGSKARRMGRVVTTCQDVIKCVKLKRTVDFNVLPELPGAEPIPLPPYMAGPRPAAVQPAQPARQPAQQPAQPRPAPQQPAQPAAAPAASSGGDTLSELHKRMLFLTDAAEKAKEQGNSSKARRMVRLIEQHQLFVKEVKSRKPIDMSAIPELPGFEPVPVPDYMRAKRPAPAAPQVQVQVPAAASQVSVKDQLKQSTADKNMEILLTRQAEYKQEALKLYKEGDQVGAKKCLGQAKGFDQMIEACKKGLPVEMSKIPPSLNAPPERRVLSRQNTLPHMSGDVIDMGPSTGDVEEIFNQLVSDLEHQIEMCKTNAQTFQKLGDLPSAKHYAQLFQNQGKDLANLKGIYKQKNGLPPYRYEGCKFPVLNSSPELSDREAEIVIVRCLNVPVPQGWKPEDLKVYATWEFTLQDKTAKGQTKSYKGGINPDIFEQFRVDIGDRSSRSFARAIKRGNVKFTAWYERGFLKKPGELGCGVVKLADWENLAEVHEAVTLLDGRKQTATKVEVKLRIREPVGGAQCEFQEMKWLVIGRSGRAPTNPQPSLSVPKKGRSGASPNTRRRQ